MSATAAKRKTKAETAKPETVEPVAREPQRRVNRFTGAVQFAAEIENLSGADLSGAYLSGHKLAAGPSLAALGNPDDWYALTYFTETGEQRVKVGCQDKTIPEGRAYWANKARRREVFAALDYAEAIGRARGWGAAPAKVA